MKSSPRFARTVCGTAVLAAFTLTPSSIVFAQTAPPTPSIAPPAAVPGSQAAADEGVPGIASVIVTSRKFTERLVDVPIAISVFSNEDLTRRGASNIADVLQNVPGVSVYDAGSGISKISIRGVSTSLGGNENGYYLDDLPFTGVTVPIVPDVRAWDLERVEVLRGPQGTLFGEGSMGGTIRILTNNARLNQFAFAGQAGVSHSQGGGDNRAVKAMINIPVINDMLAMRIAATDEDYKGWVDDPANGKTNINPLNVKTGRVRVLFKPIDDLSINATYWSNKTKAPVGNSATDAGYAPQGAKFDAASENTMKGISGTYDFNAFSIFYGYAHNDYHIAQTGDYAGGAFIASIGIDVKTHELRASSTSQKPWRWTAGLYRRTAKRSDAVVLAAFNFNQTSDTGSTASSVFGEVTYTLPDFPLEASLGLRRFRDEIVGADVNNGAPAPVSINRFNSTNPRASLAYRPSEDQQIYTSASKGFRSGQNQVTGIEALAALNNITLPSAIKPDSIWTYELGTKVSALNRRLNMEFAVYRSDWKNFAVRMPIANTGLNGLISSEGTRIKGLDASFAYAVTKSLTATLAAGLVDAKYRAAVPGTQLKAGSQVDDVPRFTISASGEYGFALPGEWKGQARAGIQHASAHTAATFALNQPGDAINNIDGRLSFLKGPWTLSLFGENLKNDRGAAGTRLGTQLSATLVEVTAPRLRPRTIGVEMRYAMGK